MNEREIERRKKYEERARKLFEQTLAKNNIEIIDDMGYCLRLKYKGVAFNLLSNSDWNSWTKHYQVYIPGGKTLATRCLLETAIAKAKKYIEEEN